MKGATTEAEYAAMDAANEAFMTYIAELNALEGRERASALMEWRRSEWWHPLLMMCLDWQGALAKEAARAGIGSPAQESWHRAFRIDDVPAIMRALRVHPGDMGAGYACHPFRIVADEGRKWIAAAVGCEPMLPVKGKGLWSGWLPIDIEHVILWRPDTGETRVLGEAKSQAVLVEPSYYNESPTIYTDTFAFFRAWIETRAAIWGRFLDKRRGKWAHPVTEPRDGALPGALVVGDIAKVRSWPSVETLIAGPGTDADALRKSVWASYNVPRVVGTAPRELRRAA